MQLASQRHCVNVEILAPDCEQVGHEPPHTLVPVDSAVVHTWVNVIGALFLAVGLGALR